MWGVCLVQSLGRGGCLRGEGWGNDRGGGSAAAAAVVVLTWMLRAAGMLQKAQVLLSGDSW